MFNPCSLCSAECCISYIITTTSFDVLRVCEKTKKKYDEFAVLHTPSLLSYDPAMLLDTNDGTGPYLLGFKSHPCIFLDKDNLCTIHDAAPLSCRYYPYTLGQKMNPRFCPLIPQILFRIKGPDIRKELLREEIESYKKIVKEWNKNPGKKEDCILFLLKRTKL